MKRAHIQQGKHIRYLLPQPPRSKFARWWLYTVPLSILAGVLIILAADITRVIICNMAFLDYTSPVPPLYFRTSYGLLRLCARDAHDKSVGLAISLEAKRDGHPCTAHSANAQSLLFAPPFDDPSLAHCRGTPLTPQQPEQRLPSGMACLLACRCCLPLAHSAYRE